MSSLATAMDYQETGTVKSKKADVRVISEMKSSRILMYLTYRHRVGLLILSNALLLAFVLYDKLGWVPRLLLHF